MLTVVRIIAVVLVCMLGSCGGKDFQYSDSNEEKPGPGLFSGEDGVFTLIKKEKEEAASEKEDAAKE